MKSQAYRMAMLYDFYGDLLTPRQKEFYDLYSSLRDLCQQIQELNEERFSDNDLDDLMQQMTTVINDMERE